MDKGKNRNVIAVAITPEFGHAILSGEKSVEFRRNGAPIDITHMVLYSTLPEQKLIGYCEVRHCVVASPQIIWREYGRFGCISEEAFLSYYAGENIGKCYIIEKAFRFVRPIALSQCKSFSRAPQSFVYVDRAEWRNLRRKKRFTANNSLKLDGAGSLRECPAT